MKFINQLLLTIAACALLCSCGTGKVVYMKDSHELSKEILNKANSAIEPSAKPGDLIQITVTSRNIEAAKPYNKSSYLGEITTNSTNDQNNQYYLVDTNGNIEFPVIGTLYINGFSKSQIRELVISKLYPNHLAECPSVEVRFKNFNVTMLGEVKSPGLVTTENERMTILQAIALAGDLTIHGEREKVRIIRTAADGTRSIHTVNLNDKELVLSPYFNLQQDDVVYVEPNGTKKRSSWSIPPAFSIILSSVGLISSLVTLGFTIFK